MAETTRKEIKGIMDYIFFMGARRAMAFFDDDDWDMKRVCSGSMDVKLANRLTHPWYSYK